MRLTGVGGIFSASHHSPEGVLHGHSYEVWAWFPQADARDLQQRLEKVLAAIDHTHLDDDLAWGEALAENIAARLPDCLEVEVRRPLERIGARWRKDPGE
jgi:6-pyruvoyl-tetrahydropterin synthase